MPPALPLVSVVIPSRDEEAAIDGCIRAVAEQDYPLDRIEVIVVDGESSDRTREVAQRALARSDFHVTHVISNPAGTTPSNLNLGLRRAGGEYLCRVDARSRIPRGYIRRCVKVLANDPRVSVVGGAQVAIPWDGTSRSLGIARALNNRWGMGLARYRRQSGSGPTDTVYLGFFRTADLHAAGGWNESFPTNQDFELNRRLGRTGVVWFAGDLAVGYLPRRRLDQIFRQYQRFGTWKVRYWRRTGDPPRPRQIALLSAPLVALAGGLFALTRPRLRAPVLAAAVASAAVVEVAGADEPRGGAATHAYAIAALGAVGVGWTSGVWTELLRGATAGRADPGHDRRERRAG